MIILSPLSDNFILYFVFFLLYVQLTLIILLISLLIFKRLFVSLTNMNFL